jgi:phosphoserine phosphatase RsbU/P
VTLSDGHESAADLYENAPCGHLSVWPDGRIAHVNQTLVHWLGFDRDALLQMQFTDLLTAGGRIHYESHFGPMLLMRGQLGGIAMDLVAADGTRMPAFVTANVKSDAGGRPVLLRITAQDARDRRSYERELLEERQRADRERAQVQVLASTLRRSLLPPSLTPPEGLDAAAYYHAASTDEVGGDFYDLFPLSPSTWGFFLGDVCGKGATAAAVTSLTRYTLRAAAVYDEDPVSVLHNLDTVLHQQFHDGDSPRFCTVLFGVITPSEGGWDIEIAGGGHPPAILVTANHGVGYVDTTAGHAVGLLPDARFVSTRIRLGAGDTLVLYTDGLTEARTGVGSQRYDDEGALLDFTARHAPATAAQIVDAMHALLDDLGAGIQDDVAILALGVPTSDQQRSLTKQSSSSLVTP